MVGYVGPNGAGKSTTIKMLTGILVPTAAASATLPGSIPSRQRRELARRIGVVFGQRTQLWWDLPLRRVARAAAAHLPRARARASGPISTGCVELLDLGEFLDTPVRQLSLGQRMRGDLAAALLHDPEILYLDEPTIGLDVVAKQRIRDFLLEINRERGTTVLLTTHDMADIEQPLPADDDHRPRAGCSTTARSRRSASASATTARSSSTSRRTRSSSGSTAPTSCARTARASGSASARDEIAAAELIGRVAARYRVRDLTIEEPEIEEIVRRIYIEGID